MYETEKRLFGQALADVAVKKLDQELLDCEETAVCSRIHNRRVKYMIAHGETPKTGKINSKYIWTIIIAAILLLTGCVALVREQIAGFGVTLQDTGNVIEISEDKAEYPNTLKTKRIPRALPAGYVLMEEIETDQQLIMTWSDSNKDRLIYMQAVIDSFLLRVNSNDGEEHGQMVIDEYILFYSVSPN